MALDITSIRFGAHPDKQRAVIDLSAPQNSERLFFSLQTELLLIWMHLTGALNYFARRRCSH